MSCWKTCRPSASRFCGDHASAYIDLLRSYLMEVLGGAVNLPPRRGRSAKPFYNLPVLSSAAAKPPWGTSCPGTQLPFEGGHNFRELGGYRPMRASTSSGARSTGASRRGNSPARLTGSC